MTREEIKQIIFNFDKPYSNVFGIINNNKKYDNIKKSIIETTSYLNKKSTISERIYHIIYDMYDKPKCKYCGLNYNKFTNFNKGYSKYCSRQCSSKDPDFRERVKKSNIKTYSENKDEIQNKIKQTNLERHGVEDPNILDNIKEKIKQTNLEEHGVESYSKTEDYKIKTKKTNLERHGVEWFVQSDDFKIKSKKTSLEKYGVESYTKTEDYKIKTKKTSLEKYGVDNVSKIISKLKIEEKKEKFKIKLFDILKEMNFELLDNYQNNIENYNWKCLICGETFIENWRNMCRGYPCPICYPRNQGFSKGEREILDFLLSYNLNVLENSRQIIKPYELDIYLPDYNLAIEYDGIYYHSDKFNENPNSHLNKTNLCKEKGIRLIHIFEDEWMFKQDIVKERLKSILNLNNDKIRIHARKCEIKEIDPKIKNEFLDQYHLQGKDSSTIKLGAFYNNELVSVMTFSYGNISKGSKKDEKKWELNRFASNYNYHIPGIASKFLSYFKKNYNWKQIYSYADKRWSNGNLYYQLGFKHQFDTKINYWYIDGNKRIHRFNLRKRKDEPKNITEFQLREKQGYLKIWDCGNMKFVLQNL